jgi:cytochrome c
MVRSLIPVLGLLALATTVAAPMQAADAPIRLAMAGKPAATGDAAKGQAIFQRCQMCHTAENGAGNRLGPNLFGVIGRKSASLPNFAYSTALKNSGITWTEDKLQVWLKNPQAMVPGTRMAFAGLSNPDDIRNVIAYLDTKK